MAETAKKCPNIDTSAGMGVPMAFFSKDSTCALGDTPINEKMDTMLK